MSEHTAARPKGQRAQQDQPVREPMRGSRRITKAPSTDQKKVRRQMVRKTATELPVEAWKLNPGDYIKGPNNQVVQVRNVRNHKTDMTKVYVDTEAGTIAVPRGQNFTMVPGGHTNRQQELPKGLGLPGGNSNMLPGAPNAGGMSPGESHGSHKCPIDGSNMQLRNQGGSSVYVCPQDGYTMPAANFGFGPSGGGGVTTDPNALNSLAMTREEFAHNVMAAMEPVTTCKHCGEEQYGHALRGGHDWVKCSNGHAYHDEDDCKACGTSKTSAIDYNNLRRDSGGHHYADTPDGGAHCVYCGRPESLPDPAPCRGHNEERWRTNGKFTWAHEMGYPPKTSAMDEGPANECKLCGGTLRTDPGQDAGADSFTASCEDCGTKHHVQRKVRALGAKTAVGVPPVHMGTCEGCGAHSPVVSWGAGDQCKTCSLTHLNRISSDHSDGSRYRQVAAHFDNFKSASSKYVAPQTSAIARRAQAVLAMEEQS